MKTKARFLIPVLITLAILAAVGGGIWFWYDNNVDRSGWIEKDGVRFYRDFHADPVSGWLELDGHTYFFGEGGIPSTGWQEIEGTTYLFSDAGHMTTGWVEEDGKTHYFGGNGALVEGWLWLEEGRYFFRDGTMVTGWQTVDEEKRYFGSDGIMVTGFEEIDGNTYYLDSDGILALGITEMDGCIYNFQDSGVMFTGWETLEEGDRYYFPEGPMAVGWAEIDGEKYYFDENGIRQHAGWKEEGEYRYYIHEDGSYAVGPTVIDGQTHYFSPQGIEVILVNGLNPVPDYYKRELVNVVDYHDVDRRCYEALTKMLADCEEAGIEYTFNSAYRTIKEQTMILEYRTLEHMRDFGMDFREAREKALDTVAIPGTSEHHLGLAVDLLGTEAVAWLTEHCWDYGFIVRYTEEKESITGIIDEPWHFRYVGTKVSLDMKDTGLCLEEYLGASAVTADRIAAKYGDKWYKEEFTTVDQETIEKYIGSNEEETPEDTKPEATEETKKEAKE